MKKNQLPKHTVVWVIGASCQIIMGFFCTSFALLRVRHTSCRCFPCTHQLKRRPLIPSSVAHSAHFTKEKRHNFKQYFTLHHKQFLLPKKKRIGRRRAVSFIPINPLLPLEQPRLWPHYR
ncbi:hypothetical protein XELAEV_18006881mg [Xenopus laevis]|uniref:Uncharacterized protein n=1 Tax=Xenopus laevis TaxID=8355 RepID=A0A974E1Q5_XENLA|nr:hypothetical protein XELAEV_18006881mg [Xenopus laevis]